jgi:Head domain of trimeric autotransporter adhesin
MTITKTSSAKDLAAFIFFLATLFFLPVINAGAQNVGLGTTNPQATLDVKGNQRTGGVNHFMNYDSATGRFTWSNSNLWLTSSQYLMKHSPSLEGLYYGNSQLEYRNDVGFPVFFTNWSSGNGYFSSKLGIGIATPQFPLSFLAATGDKISLYGDSGPHYGLGVQPYLLQIHTDLSASDIAFGYGNSGSFTETMRIKGNGNAGIGTNNPLARLHVADSNVLFSANGDIPGTAGNTPVIGAGRRMMWYADKAAFRAGYVPSTEWDKNNIGIYSTALGYGTMANATGTTAIGYQSTASGVYSTAMGYQTNSKALGSFVIGNNNDITDNPDPNNPLPLDRIFQIGNGDFSSVRTNALTVLRNGNMGIGTSTPANKLTVSGNADITGHLGIGVSSSSFPLSFSNTLGDKISLSGTSGSHYGFGIQSNLLQIHTDGVTSDIAFGYGSSGSFTEKFRIKGTGALAINGNTGAAGQVIKSNGSSAPPSWVTPTNSLYNNTIQLTPGSSVVISDEINWTPLTGMTNSFITSGNAKVIVMFNVQVFPGPCTGCGATRFHIGVYVDNVLTLNAVEDVANSSFHTFSGNYLALITSGSGAHTIDIRAIKSGPDATFFSHNMILQIIPE